MVRRKQVLRRRGLVASPHALPSQAAIPSEPPRNAEADRCSAGAAPAESPTHQAGGRSAFALPWLWCFGRDSVGHVPLSSTPWGCHLERESFCREHCESSQCDCFWTRSVTGSFHVPVCRGHFLDKWDMWQRQSEPR